MDGNCSDELAAHEALSLLVSNAEAKIGITLEWVKAILRKSSNPHIELNEMRDNLNPNDSHVIFQMYKETRIEVFAEIDNKNA